MKIPKIVLGAAGVAAALSISACNPVKSWNPQGVKITQERITRTMPLSGFKAIDVDRQFYTVITVGPAYSVTVNAPQDFFEHNKIKVEDNTLEINYDSNLNFDKAPKNTQYNTSRPVVTVTLPALEEVEATGQSSATISGQLKGNFKASASGQSWIGIAGQQSLNALSLDITGQSSMGVDSINAVNVNVDCNGQSGLNVNILKCNNINIDCSGQSSIGFKTLATGKIQADVAGQASLQLGTFTATSGSVEASGMSSISAGKSSARGVSVSSSGMSSIKIK